LRACAPLAQHYLELGQYDKAFEIYLLGSEKGCFNCLYESSVMIFKYRKVELYRKALEGFIMSYLMSNMYAVDDI
jgi:hypothetical protein